MIMKKWTLTILITSLFFFLNAQEIQVETSVDWQKKILRLDMTAPISDESNQPTGRYKTEQFILRETPVTTGEVLLPIVVNSWNTMEDLVKESPVLLRRLENLSQIMNKVFTTATPDRKYLTVRYELSLFPHVADLLITHDKPYSYPINPAYTANEDFTGIVIYAAESLPWHNSGEERQSLNPCLFPRLFSPDLKEIHSMELTYPDALSRWGNAGYTYSANISEMTDRIGVYPYRTMARAIYGKKKTDLILSEKAAAVITGSEHNRELLRQGKVMIILPEK